MYFWLLVPRYGLRGGSGRLASDPHATAARLDLSLPLSQRFRAAATETNDMERIRCNHPLPLQQFYVEQITSVVKTRVTSPVPQVRARPAITRIIGEIVGQESRRHLECRSFKPERRTTTLRVDCSPFGICFQRLAALLFLSAVLQTAA